MSTATPKFDPATSSKIVHEALRELALANERNKSSAETKAAAPREPDYTKAAVKAAKNQVLFSALFGVKVEHDFPVTVLKSSDLPAEVRSLVPKADPAYELQVDEAYYLMQAWESGDKTMLAGPTGSGKSSLIK